MHFCGATCSTPFTINGGKKMKQRARVFIEFPDGVNVAMLKDQLEDKGCKVEVEAVLLLLAGVELPDEFKFKDEK